MQQLPGRILITGANGHLGRQLIARLAQGGTGGVSPEIRAMVRSERAAEQVRAVGVTPAPQIVVGDYTDEAFVTEALAGCDAVVHLVGIIKAGRSASYRAAHEDTCEVLAGAASKAGVRRIVYLSIVGSHPAAKNPCLASKGRAEEILLAGPAPTTVIRVPMVLGPDDYASAALRGRAKAGVVALVRGGASIEQPIDGADVVSAIVAALSLGGGGSSAIDLGGPEPLSHRELVLRAAEMYGKRPVIIPIPEWVARGFAAILERLIGDPPVTTAMLQILQHDDRVDQTEGCRHLGIRLTPLDETLRRYVGPGSERHG